MPEEKTFLDQHSLEAIRDWANAKFAQLKSLAAEYDATSTYSVDDLVVHDGALYQAKEEATGTWDSSKWNEYTLDTAIKELANKASVDGNYPTLTSGNADQLNSTVFVVDKVPYLYRTSGGDADIGNREYDKIIGGSLAVNQLAKELNANNWTIYNASASYSDGVVTLTATGDNQTISYTQNNQFVKGHKILIAFEVVSTTSPTATFRIRYPFVSDWVSVTAGRKNIIGTVADTDNSQLGIQLGYMTTDENVVIKNVVCFDLTQMFGSTIADYIYSLEQANAGAGVAWLRNYFKEEYYPSSEGAIKNVKLVSHDMIGFNQWDEETESGVININTGENVAEATQIRSKNYYPCLPNTTYYGKVGANYPIVMVFYDANKNFLTGWAPGGANYIGVNNATFTTPENAAYFRFYCVGSYGTTYNHDICINLSWSGWRNGQYEPYQKNSYPLDTTIELRGIPKLDSNNHLYFDGDEYFSDGKVVRKYGVVDLGTLSWSKIQWGTGEVFQATLNGVALKDTCLLCSKYSVVAQNSMYNNPQDKTITNNYGFSWNIKIVDSAYTTAGEFAAAMSGVYLVYELATPTEENAAPFQEPQIVDDFGTEEYVVPTQDGWQVPVGHDTKYPANLRDKLQRLPDMPSVSQNVTETYVVNYNGATKKCTFVDIAGWLGANGWIKLTDITGYDATKTQTLKNVNGTLTWVDD